MAFAGMFVAGIVMVFVVLAFPQASGVVVFAMFVLLLVLVGMVIRNIFLNIIGKN